MAALSLSDITILVATRQSCYEQTTKAIGNTRNGIPVLVVGDEGKGKKYALYKGMQLIQTPFVWLQDDDITPPQDLSSLLQQSDDFDLLILPLRMSSSAALLERLQQTEYAAIQSLTIWAAQRGKAVMCSGANMIVRREEWLQSYPDLHTDLPSGDDMFLLESFKRRHLRIRCATAPVATISPQPTLKQLFRQRTRWAGKAPHYTDRDILLCGTVTILLNVLSVLLPPLWLLRLVVEHYFVRLAKRLHLIPQINHWVFFLLSLLYPYYIATCAIGGLFSKNRWS